MIGANIGKFLNDVAGLVESKKAPEIVDISNQSSKEGTRIVLELKKGADVERITNLLYKKTRLEDTFGVNMLAVADGRPETLSLKQVIEHHVDFQFEVATRKYQNLLRKEMERREVQEGLIKACDVIDLIIEILRGSKTQKQVKECLIMGVTDGIRFKSKSSERMACLLYTSDHKILLSVSAFLHFHFSADFNLSDTFFVDRQQVILIDDNTAGREIRSFDGFHQTFDGDVVVFHVGLDRWV